MNPEFAVELVKTMMFQAVALAAPILITCARIVQGFSVGGGFGSAVAFLAEHGSARKGFSASWQWASTGVVSVIVALFRDRTYDPANA